MTNDQTLADHPGVAVHPPFFFLGAMIIAAGFQRLWPMSIFASDVGVARIVGGLLVVAGVGMIAAGRKALETAGTNIDPRKPTTTIVQTGPYRFSRNPLYLSLTIISVGLTLLLNTWWGVILLIPVLLTMHFCVVLREERYLDRKFGESYRQYRNRVRRYF